MRLPFPLRLNNRRGLLVYQLVLVLIGIVILILVLLYIARRNQIGSPASSAERVQTHGPMARWHSADAAPLNSAQGTIYDEIGRPS